MLEPRAWPQRRGYSNTTPPIIHLLSSCYPLMSTGSATIGRPLDWEVQSPIKEYVSSREGRIEDWNQIDGLKQLTGGSS